MREAITGFFEKNGWGDAIHSLNQILDHKILENTLADFLFSTVLLFAVILVLSILKKIILAHLEKHARKPARDFDDMLLLALNKIKSPSIIALGLYAATFPIALTPAFASVIKYACILILTVQAVQVIQVIANYGVRTTYRRARPNDFSSEAVIGNISFAVRWGLWILAAIFILDNFGINITTLVAGLGIGGIAVAMASQAILGDAFSALSIFLDKPFEIGDFIIVDDYMGTVEHVGIKTTKIRSLFGEQLIFANSDLTKSRVKNYKRMEMRRITFKFGVTYQTPLEKIKKIPLLVRHLCDNVSGIKLDRAHFQSFGDFALIFEVVYYVLSPDYNIYMDKQQEINLALKEILEKEGVEFAYPTQTVFLTKMS